MFNFLKQKDYFFYFIIFLIFINGCERPVDINSANDNFPPAAPEGLNVYAQQDGEVGLEWKQNVDDDLSGYNVYRKTSSRNFEIIAFTTDNFFVDDSLDYDTTYFYRITAVDNSGRESAPSNRVTAKPVNLFKPLPPRDLNINARNWQGDISIYLNWQPGFETDIKGYNVYRSTNASFVSDSSSFVGFTTENNFSDTLNLDTDILYYYKIKSVDKGNLLSDDSQTIEDKILGIPEIIFPQNNSEINFFDNFIIKGLTDPANYKIIVQTNEFFGEFWSKSFFSSVTNDTIIVKFDPPYIEAGKNYYWRIITFTNNNSEPNSVSKLFAFKIKN